MTNEFPKEWVSLHQYDQSRSNILKFSFKLSFQSPPVMGKTDQIITKGKLTVALQECVCAWTLWREWINDPNYEFNLFFHFNIVQIHYSKTVVCLHYYFLIRRNISEQCACIHAHLLCLDFIFTYLCKCETFKSVVHAIVSELWRVCLKLFFFFFLMELFWLW